MMIRCVVSGVWFRPPRARLVLESWRGERTLDIVNWSLELRFLYGREVRLNGYQLFLDGEQIGNRVTADGAFHVSPALLSAKCP